MDWTIIQSNSLILSAFIALFILIFGIALGKLISYVLTKISDKLEINKRIKPSFIEIIITLIKWSIYLVFVDLSLSQLPLTNATGFVSGVLLIIPLFIGAIILIALGFALGNYVKEAVEDAQIKNGKFLSMYFFYFIILTSGVYAIRLALYSLKDTILNYIILIAATVFFISIAYENLKKI